MKERIYELVHGTNFQPFTITMSDDRSYHVPTRDHILVTRTPGAQIVIQNDRGSLTILAGLHISSVNMDDELQAHPA